MPCLYMLALGPVQHECSRLVASKLRDMAEAFLGFTPSTFTDDGRNCAAFEPSKVTSWPALSCLMHSVQQRGCVRRGCHGPAREGSGAGKAPRQGRLSRMPAVQSFLPSLCTATWNRRSSPEVCSCQV